MDLKRSLLSISFFQGLPTDAKLISATKLAHENCKYVATSDESVYCLAEFIVCDINLDLAEDK